MVENITKFAKKLKKIKNPFLIRRQLFLLINKIGQVGLDNSLTTLYYILQFNSFFSFL